MYASLFFLLLFPFCFIVCSDLGASSSATLSQSSEASSCSDTCRITATCNFRRYKYCAAFASSASVDAAENFTRRFYVAFACSLMAPNVVRPNGINNSPFSSHPCWCLRTFARSAIFAASIANDGCVMRHSLWWLDACFIFFSSFFFPYFLFVLLFHILELSLSSLSLSFLICCQYPLLPLYPKLCVLSPFGCMRCESVNIVL